VVIPGGAATGATHPLVLAALVAPQLAIGVAVPSPPFPNTTQDIIVLRHSQLQVLAILYNQTFGIVQGDPLPVRQAKFQAWIRGF